MGVTDIEAMARQIIKAFPTEAVEFYFQRTENGYKGTFFHLCKNEKSKISKTKKRIAAMTSVEEPAGNKLQKFFFNR